MPKRPEVNEDKVTLFRRDPGASTVVSTEGFRYCNRKKKANHPVYKQDWKCSTTGCPAYIFVTGEWETDGDDQFMRGVIMRTTHGSAKGQPKGRPHPPPAAQPKAKDIQDIAADMTALALEPAAQPENEGEDEQPQPAAQPEDEGEDARRCRAREDDELALALEDVDEEPAANLADLTTQAADSDVEEEGHRYLSQAEAEQMRLQIARDAENAPVTYRRDHPDIAVPRQLPRHAPGPREQFRTAVEEGELEELKRIYQAHRRGLQAEDPELKERALHGAAYNNHVDVCKWLLSVGADPEWRTGNGWNVLHRAARRANPLVVELLLSHGMSVNSLASGKLTPLHLAINSKEDRKLVNKTVQVLLGAKGIDLLAVSTAGDTPLMLAQGIDAEMTKMIETRLSAN